MRWFIALLLTCTTASAQGVSTVGGLTVEACATLVVTASSAYTANNEVGGLISLKPTFRATGSGVPDSGGIVQSIRLDFKDAQTATFKAYQFSANPSASTWTDKTAPAINAADVFKVKGPITLSTADSGLGTHTVYQADAVARAHVASGATDYWVLVTTGTPTFATTADVQFCASYLVD